VSIFEALPLAPKLHLGPAMHVSIERLYEFVMGWVNFTEAEQEHLVHCGFCVQWLDACMQEKVALLIDSIRFS
jgi:hypothetical protein